MAIHDEGIVVLTAIQSLTDTDPHLALEMRWWWQECAAVNAVHIHWLAQIQELPDFWEHLNLVYVMWMNAHQWIQVEG